MFFNSFRWLIYTTTLELILAKIAEPDEPTASRRLTAGLHGQLAGKYFPPQTPTIFTLSLEKFVLMR